MVDEPDRIPEPVWTYRGYQLKAGDFNTAMVHFFRAEVQRANVWRQRLDATTNWAVITTGAVLSFAFSQTQSSHLVILFNLFLVTLFLGIEARRYRYYELWSYRVRMMETDFFAAMLVPPFQPAPDWAEALAESLLHPQYPISELEAIGRRLRRNYLWIYIVLIAAWLAKLLLFPEPAVSATEFIQRAGVDNVGGVVVLAVVGLFMLLVFATGIGTIGLQHASGEVLPRYFSELRGGKAAAEGRAWFRRARQRAQVLTFVVTSSPETLSASIVQELRRGVTVVAGKGGFSGQDYAVLMCALTVTEIPHLKALAVKADPAAFVVVTPAQNVFGRGFSPLEET